MRVRWLASAVCGEKMTSTLPEAPNRPFFPAYSNSFLIVAGPTSATSSSARSVGMFD